MGDATADITGVAGMEGKSMSSGVIMARDEGSHSYMTRSGPELVDPLKRAPLARIGDS